MSDVTEYVVMVTHDDSAKIINTKNLGLVLVNKDIYKIPERSIDIIDVPGSNGSYVIDNGYYKNVVIWYEFEMISGAVVEAYDLISKTLNQFTGKYIRIYDSYQDLLYDYGTYRLGVIINEGTITQTIKTHGKMKIEFNCKPYRYISSGTSEIPIDNPLSPEMLINPTNEIAYPLITIYAVYVGSESYIQINDTRYNFDEFTGVLVVDCEKKFVMESGGSVLPDILQSPTYPVLAPGNNTIIANVPIAIIPRWRTL